MTSLRESSVWLQFRKLMRRHQKMSLICNSKHGQSMELLKVIRQNILVCFNEWNLALHFFNFDPCFKKLGPAIAGFIEHVRDCTTKRWVSLLYRTDWHICLQQLLHLPSLYLQTTHVEGCQSSTGCTLQRWHWSKWNIFDCIWWVWLVYWQSIRSESGRTSNEQSARLWWSNQFQRNSLKSEKNQTPVRAAILVMPYEKQIWTWMFFVT